MTYEKFKSKLDHFIEYNSELVDEYNSFSELPLHSVAYPLHKIVENIREKYNGVSVFSIMNMVLPIAIADKTSVIEIAESIFENGQFSKETSKTPLQIYFDDIKTVYNRNGNDYDIEYCEENRDKLIEMNLKTVVAIAKNFKGLGLPMEDLIGAGNLGLCVAFDKFDPKRIKMKTELLEAVDNVEAAEMSYDDVAELMSPVLEYGKTKIKFHSDFSAGKKYTKKTVKSWISHNVTNARFNSVAVMWIRAYILIELDNCSRLIKKSKSDIRSEKNNGKDVYISIDDRVGESGNTKISDILYIPDESVTLTENAESQMIFRDFMEKVLDGVRVRNRRILLQRFGIGYPRPMMPKEIATREHLSIARVSQIVQNTLEKMRENCRKYNIDPAVIYEAIENIY